MAVAGTPFFVGTGDSRFIVCDYKLLIMSGLARCAEKSLFPVVANCKPHAASRMQQAANLFTEVLFQT